jgi:hypothetical protein
MLLLGEQPKGTRGMAPTDNTVARTLHDVGLAAWFGGSLLGATGVNGAAAVVEDPTQRLRVANTGWARWTPLNLAGIAARRQHGQDRPDCGRAGQHRLRPGVGQEAGAAGDVPIEGGTTPNPTTPEEVARAQRQLTALQWVIPVLTRGGAGRQRPHGRAAAPRPSQQGPGPAAAPRSLAGRQLSSAWELVVSRERSASRSGRPTTARLAGPTPWSIQASSHRADGRRTLSSSRRGGG